jgi:hypothetical protein
MGEGNRSAIGTLVERSTRYTMLVHLPNGHDCESVREGLIATIATLPAHLRGSLTWDQGAEMARHKQFSMVTDMAVYFCDPTSPWHSQRSQERQQLALATRHQREHQRTPAAQTVIRTVQQSASHTNHHRRNPQSCCCR